MEIVYAANQAEENTAFSNGAKLVIRTDLLTPVPSYLDFSSFTEVDPTNVFTLTTNELVFTSLKRDSSTYAYKDYGVSHFLNYEVDFKYIVNTCSSGSVNFNMGLLSFANAIGDREQVRLAQGNLHGLMAGNSGAARFLCLSEINVANSYVSTFFNPVLDTAYYCTFKRDDTAGTYGTLTLNIYSDEARTQLITSLNLTLHSRPSFRYFYLAQSVNTNQATVSMSGKIANVVLK
jgi:hypothetical protein